MELSEIIGYLAAALIGLSLALTGAGGSILTVPILVYLFGIDPIQSTAYSLFVVGSVATGGTIASYSRYEVDTKVALMFGIPSVISIFLTRKFIISALPPVLLQFGDWQITSGIAILLLFAVLMIYSSIGMIKKRNIKVREEVPVRLDPRLCVQGLFVGFITGLVGAGGGFLIIPALVLVAGLPIKRAIGTSLFIVCCNAFIGFAGDVSERNIDWSFLLPFSAIAIAGIFIGLRLKDKIAAPGLRKGFGYFILLIAVWIIVNEIRNF